MEPEEGSITHVTGDTFHIPGRTVQRCGVCGALLCDSKGRSAMLNPDGSEPTFPTFPAGRLVRVCAGNPTRMALLPDTDKLPPDSCVDLLP